MQAYVASWNSTRILLGFLRVDWASMQAAVQAVGGGLLARSSRRRFPWGKNKEKASINEKTVLCRESHYMKIWSKSKFDKGRWTDAYSRGLKEPRRRERQRNAKSFLNFSVWNLVAGTKSMGKGCEAMCCNGKEALCTSIKEWWGQGGWQDLTACVVCVRRS